MRTGSWIRRQRDPIAEHERHAAFMVTAAVAVTATLFLAITAPHAPSPHAAPDPRDGARLQQAPQAHSGGNVAVALTGEAERAARVFLHGYLGYIYGHNHATAVKGTTGALARSLAGSVQRVPPGMSARHPRVVALHIANAPAGLIRVTAVINDGGLLDYPIALLLAHHGSRLLVTGLDGA